MHRGSKESICSINPKSIKTEFYPKATSMAFHRFGFTQQNKQTKKGIGIWLSQLGNPESLFYSLPAIRVTSEKSNKRLKRFIFKVRDFSPICTDFCFTYVKQEMRHLKAKSAFLNP